MNYSEKFVLDDVAVVTHQKFPPYLTRANFKNNAAFEQYFNLLNDTLIALERGVEISQFSRFSELCQLLQKEAILEPDPTLQRIDDYAEDYLNKIGDFVNNAFTIDECDQVILQPDNQDNQQRNEVEYNLGTLDVAKVNFHGKVMAQGGNTVTVQLYENMYGREFSYWWREQDFEL